MTAAPTGPRRFIPPKGLVLKAGLFWAKPTPNPPRGEATHERLQRQRQFDFDEESN
jgi:hypothetical protein